MNSTNQKEDEMKRKVVAINIGGVPYMNLDQTDTFNVLKDWARHPIDLSKLRPSDATARINECVISGSQIYFNFGFKQVISGILDAFQNLANEMRLIDKYRNILRGEIINTSEERKVLHPHTRGDLSDLEPRFDVGAHKFYLEQRTRIFEFVQRVHRGEIVGSTGQNFKRIYHIGIGGSDLGPKAVYEALERYVFAKNDGVIPMKADFISNVDPDDANYAISKLIRENKDRLEDVLFIVVSKSGTTLETLTNETLVREIASETGIDVNKHFVAVTGKGSPMDSPSKYLASFYIDDNIGGRYSTSSAVGTTVLSLAFGVDVVREFHEGMHQGDRNALNPDVMKNIAMMDALLAVWDRVFLNYPAVNVVAYSQALKSLIEHKIQVDPESLGKRVNLFGQPVGYETGRDVSGGVGTNLQHANFQLRHQGTTVVPMQFIVFNNPQIDRDIEVKGTTSQQKLLSNVIAQMVTMARGKNDPNPSKVFPGNRPTTLLYAEKLTPIVLGEIFASLEHSVMFQGNILNVNTWDQDGVQAGKLAANQLLDVIVGKIKPEEADPFMVALARQVGLLSY